MKVVLAFITVLSAAAATVAMTEEAQAVVYCTYVGFPKGCVAKPGVVLRVRPVARAVTPRLGAPRGAVRPGVPGNRGGGANRVGPR